jgi:hypothetical protein
MCCVILPGFGPFHVQLQVLWPHMHFATLLPIFHSQGCSPKHTEAPHTHEASSACGDDSCVLSGVLLGLAEGLSLCMSGAASALCYNMS